MSSLTSTVVAAVTTFISGIGQAALDRLEQVDLSNTIIALAVSVSATGLVILARTWLTRVRPTLGELAAARAFLANLADPEALVSNFMIFHGLMKRSPMVRHGWTEFVKSFPEPDSDQPARIEIVIRPGVFLNLAEAGRSGLRLDGLDIVGRILVAGGIILASVQLVAGLMAAPEAVIGNFPTGTDLPAVTHLAQSTPPTIWAALIAVLAGLLLMLAGWRWATRLTEAFDALARELERLTVTIGAATILNRTYREVRSQSEDVRRFAQTFSATVTETLETVIAESASHEIAAAVERTLNRTLPKILSDAMTEAMGPVAASVGRMTAEVGGAVERSVGRDLAAVSDTLAALPAQIASAAADLQGAAQSLRREMTELSVSFAQGVDSARDVHERQMAATATGLAEASQTVRDALEQAGLTLRMSADAAGKAFAAQVEGMAGHLDRTSNRSAEAVTNSFADAATAMRRTVTEASGQIDTTLAQVRQRTGELGLALGTVEAQIAGHVSALQDINRATRDAEGSLTTSAQALSDTALPLSRTAELMTQAMTTVVRNVETAVRGLTESQRLAGQLSNDLRQTAHELKNQRGTANPAGRPPPVWGGAKKP